MFTKAPPMVVVFGINVYGGSTSGVYRQGGKPKHEKEHVIVGEIKRERYKEKIDKGQRSLALGI